MKSLGCRIVKVINAMQDFSAQGLKSVFNSKIRTKCLAFVLDKELKAAFGNFC